MRNDATPLAASPTGSEQGKLPMAALLALSTAVFVTSLTETLPPASCPR
ncbi:hypothetical protein [Nonomuraea dietziae]